MIAEEELRERYRRLVDISENTVGQLPLWIDRAGSVHLSPRDIDLIVNLVIERLRGEK